MMAPAIPPAIAPIMDFSKTVRAFIRVLDCILRLDWVEREGFGHFCDMGFAGFGGFRVSMEEREVEEKRGLLLVGLSDFWEEGFVGFLWVSMGREVEEKRRQLLPLPLPRFFFWFLNSLGEQGCIEMSDFWDLVGFVIGFSWRNPRPRERKEEEDNDEEELRVVVVVWVVSLLGTV